MSKKDYILIASVLNRWVSDESLRALLFVEMGEALKKANPTFDLNKWFAANGRK